ncbi:hypothetical protein B0H63DRAFT_288176 [Podospora didyma]|uniref:Calpain catalytic domain-containing protein n=1 Tax=Podospora didyma TaxID=330526 RepID=A0AAE0K8I5_9PEZI|nr:hypothetical protein B0H63DRAFT_288176 [Podospora didyma]
MPAPQDLVGDFWQSFVTKKPGKVTAIFPSSLYETLLPHPQDADSGTSKRNFGQGYEAAAAECRTKVARIVRDCKRTNTKWTDPNFDIRGSQRDCLVGLLWQRPSPRANPWSVDDALSTLQENQVLGEAPLVLDIPTLRKILTRKPIYDEDSNNDETFDPDPGSVHRVNWIYEDPQFTINGMTDSDIMQGSNSEDCWWLSAVATICHREDLMDKICVARDEECGVYGFVFYRDGCWVSTIVDDNLLLKNPDFSAVGGNICDPSNSAMRTYRKAKQTGSEALYFASCRDPNETWLPLLEKAYAKAHGDYNAIWGGWIGEGVEDLTGGIYTEMVLEDVLYKESLWKELLNEEKCFVFGLDILDAGATDGKNGLANCHAYSLLEAREETGEDGKRVRLVKVRNPWGSRGQDGVGEWNGPWSDGSKEWSPYWLTKLNYRFENDGVFWMTYSDLLGTFTNLYRTRLFDESWTVTQEWTSVNVAWLTGYLQRKFIVEIKKAGTVVIVLQQLDTRYFRGLEGEYNFLLHFILQKQNSDPGDYICRVRPKAENFWQANRSVSCEADLEPGIYEVLPKITAMKDGDRPAVEKILQQAADVKPQKLRQVGLSFDLAHSKALRAPAVPAAAKEEEETPAKEEEEKATSPEDSGEKAEEEQEEEEEDAEESETEDEDEDEEEDGEEEGEKGNEEVAPEGEKEDGEDEGGKQEGDNAEAKPASEKASRAPSVNTGLEPPPPDGSRPPSQLGPEDAGDRGGNGGGEGGGDGDHPAPWNAVCVIGLRVYSQDDEVAIQLADPKDPQEASSLAVE